MKSIKLKTLLVLILTIAISINTTACSTKSKKNTGEKTVIQSATVEDTIINTEVEKTENNTSEKDTTLAFKPNSDEGKTTAKSSTKTNTESNSSSETVVKPAEPKEDTSQKPNDDSEKTPAPNPSTTTEQPTPDPSTNPEPPTPDPSRDEPPSYPNPTGKSIIQYACDFRGIEYRWGGTSPEFGFDASGFVQYVFKEFDITVGRYAREQIKVGNPVSKEDLREGDLVFFGTDINSPSHVGIYVGNNAFIHSPCAGDVVKISSLPTKDYLAARRVLK